MPPLTFSRRRSPLSLSESLARSLGIQQERERGKREATRPVQPHQPTRRESVRIRAGSVGTTPASRVLPCCPLALRFARSRRASSAFGAPGLSLSSTFTTPNECLFPFRQRLSGLTSQRRLIFFFQGAPQTVFPCSAGARGARGRVGLADPPTAESETPRTPDTHLFSENYTDTLISPCIKYVAFGAASN